MKRKILSVVLAMTLSMSAIVPAFGEEQTPSGENDGTSYATENQTDSLSDSQGTSQDTAADNEGAGQDTASDSEGTSQDTASDSQGAIQDTDSDSGESSQDTDGETFKSLDASVVTGGGYLETEEDSDAAVAEESTALYRSAALPASYRSDLSTLRSTYPTVRAQGGYGTCWAFAALGLMEFNLTDQGLADQSLDLSALQLSYFTYNFVTDPLNGTQGDVSIFKGEGQTNYLTRGGNYAYAARRLAQWIGAAKESSAPYTSAEGSINSGLDSSLAYGKDVAHLQNYFKINLKEQPEAVKKAVQEYGGAGIMLYLNRDLMKTDSSGTFTYYDTKDNEYKPGSHTVVIVGWDNTYSKDNFPQDNRPSTDGAWLVRNSWGAGAENADYFWLSYETHSIQKTAWVFDATVAGQADYYDNNYQLDGGLGATPSVNTTVANVFTSKEVKGITAETLKAVSISLAKANVQYKIEIYTDLKNEKDPTSGNLQKNATTEGETTYEGMYTIPLNEEISLSPGSSYGVVVTVNQSGALYQEYTTTDGGGGSWRQEISSGNGKSFYLSGNAYQVEAGGNYCIKAYTNNVGKAEEEPLTTPSVQYKTHIQTYGWQDWVANGAVAGTSGQAKRLEAIDIALKNAPYEGSIRYTTHVQTYGWQADMDDVNTWACDGAMAGTSGEAKRLEAIKIQLTGEMAEHYDVYYRVHAQTYGWLGWAKNGESAGTSGYGKRLEAIQIVLLAKGAAAPGNTYQDVTSVSQEAMQAKEISVNYSTHVQTYGWQSTVSNGAMAGTSGIAKRLEGIKISLSNTDHSGGIAYTTHVQTYGWQQDANDPSSWLQNGEMAGTSGQAKRLEAICMKLTGNLEEYYDVYYRVHIQTYGWLAWAKNGEASGSEGLGKRLEGIQIVLVKKGENAPADTYEGVTTSDSRTFIY